MASPSDTPRPFVPRWIISGGQTGVDRGALDAAMELGIPHGGWCPAGRVAEDGRIPDQYELQEHASSHYPDRTEQNVVDTDATLILYRNKLSGGTALTKRICRREDRPCLAVNLRSIPAAAKRIRRWLNEIQPDNLNVAGPRESNSPGICQETHELMRIILQGGGDDQSSLF
ncbi:putative molybdenum carrier protein [Rhodopirellula sp. JC740]|uniref:Molybdenum carrier protein n=1 Tax=Rhodopirellula halodulae TaxID=2894198 RepID=A0ABS8NQ99_9BACT|nr:putative molybdenum carrier protein [Rhodopirellula sp. JC740]MCC9644636.1 putative molybdenum carrier protein [Rhodopirellula sp. JC740]